jgi:hypothetical protein
MLLLKACPHCRGDLVLEQDRVCGYLTCVQCGHVLSTAEESTLGYRVTTLGALHVHPGSRASRRSRRTTRTRRTLPAQRAATPTSQARLELVKSPVG